MRLLSEVITIPWMGNLLRVLCFLAGIYGVGFGLMSIPTALFVGPHLLFAALGHIAVGAMFPVAALAIGRNRRWGTWLALFGSLVAGAFGIAGLFESAREREAVGIVFFSLFAGYFLLAAAVAAFFAARPKITY